MSSGLSAGPSSSRRSPRRPRARRRGFRRRTGQRSIAITWCARAAEKPTSSTSWVPRRAWNTARRRPSPWASMRSATGAVDAGLAQRRRRPDRASTRDRRAVCQCCTAQPPQTPKCGQIGAMRSALGISTWSSCRRSGWPGTVLDLDRLARQRAGDINRTVGAVGDAVAAMAEPVDHETLNHARTCLDEKFAVAVAAEDRRGNDAADAPAERRQERADVVADRCMHRRVAHDAFLDVAAASASNCGLISASSVARGASNLPTAGMTSLSEMKLTSTAANPAARRAAPDRACGYRFAPWTTMSSRPRRRGCSWPRPTSTA